MNQSNYFGTSTTRDRSMSFESISAAGVISTVVLIFFLKIAYSYFTSPLRRLPGPFLAKFTDAWRLGLVYGGHAEKHHGRLHKELGPAVRLGPNMVSISDPAMVGEIYSRKNVLLKSDFYKINDMNVNGRRVPSSFSTRDEQFHTQVTKPVSKSYSMGALLKMEPLLDSTITYFIQRLEEEFSSNKPCNMAKWVHYCAWDVLSEITFSKRMGFLEQGTDVNGLTQIGAAAMDYFSIIGNMPWLDYLLVRNPIKSIGPPFFFPLVQFALQRIADRRSGSDNFEKSSTPDFLDTFLDIQKQNSGVITDDMVLSYLMVNIVAGSDTVAVEVRSIIYHLSKNREMLVRLQDELDHATSEADKPLSWAQIQNLPYLCACVDEGMRLVPAVSTPLERVVGEGGMTLSDGTTRLPPGTIVGMNPAIVNQDREVFGDNPDEFHPDRWLLGKGETETNFQQRVSRMRNTDLTFGAGKRVCPGRNLALLECHKIIAELVRAFDVELVHPEREWKTVNRWFLRQTDMDMRLRRRK